MDNTEAPASRHITGIFTKADFVITEYRSCTELDQVRQKRPRP